MDKKFLTVNEAANYLGFCPDYMYQLVFQKRVPYYKPSGRKVLFKVAELDKWVESGRIDSKNEISAKVEDLMTKTLN